MCFPSRPEQTDRVHTILNENDSNDVEEMNYDDISYEFSSDSESQPEPTPALNRCREKN